MCSAQRAQGNVGVFPETIAGALAYITFIPAILFLVLEPYKKNSFVRFHSVQCLLLWLAGALAAAVLKLAAVLLFRIAVAGPLIIVLASGLCGLAAFLLWLVLVVKALQGEMFKLPLLGPFASRLAGEA